MRSEVAGVGGGRVVRYGASGHSYPHGHGIRGENTLPAGFWVAEGTPAGEMLERQAAYDNAPPPFINYPQRRKTATLHNGKSAGRPTDNQRNPQAPNQPRNNPEAGGLLGWRAACVAQNGGDIRTALTPGVKWGGRLSWGRLQQRIRYRRGGAPE